MNASDQERGMVRIACAQPVAATAERLESVLRARGVMVFARIDFSGDAERAGLSMRPEQLILCGNPRAGTPLMVAQPTAGLDLPFKVLLWEDAQGHAWLAYNAPRYIVERHELDGALAQSFAPLVSLIEQAGQG
jgi:uncharacterized protein (DUF302 family)